MQYIMTHLLLYVTSDCRLLPNYTLVAYCFPYCFPCPHLFKYHIYTYRYLWSNQLRSHGPFFYFILVISVLVRDRGICIHIFCQKVYVIVL